MHRYGPKCGSLLRHPRLVLLLPMCLRHRIGLSIANTARHQDTTGTITGLITGALVTANTAVIAGMVISMVGVITNIPATGTDQGTVGNN